MTKQYILDAITSTIEDTVPTAGPTQTLTQNDLTAITDAIAEKLETVNPNGPGYPSTPK